MFEPRSGSEVQLVLKKRVQVPVLVLINLFSDILFGFSVIFYKISAQNGSLFRDRFLHYEEF